MEVARQKGMLGLGKIDIEVLGSAITSRLDVLQHDNRLRQRGKEGGVVLYITVHGSLLLPDKGSNC